MATERLRRARGDGGLHWDETRQRWIGTVTTGYDNRGKRVIRKVSARTKTEAGAKLKALLRDFDDGIAVAVGAYTVAEAVADWLTYGMPGVGSSTLDKNRSLAETHVVPELGRRRLRELTADEVDKWLSEKSKTLSTRTLQGIHSCLNRAVKRAMARDKVKRNVVALCAVPQGKAGRPSKALTMSQAQAVLRAVQDSRLGAYIVISLLTGARTEELRALRWDHVDLKGEPEQVPAIPPYIAVWRSVRVGGDTKTRKSRRTLALPLMCQEALARQRRQQDAERTAAGERWTEQGLVFTSKVGTPLDPSHVRRDFRAALRTVEGMDPAAWTPRELRHSFVSLLSDSGMTLEEISRLVGHSSTAVTELVYRKQIRPVVQTGAMAMDVLFGDSAAG